ncbi:T9SS sorting signal type C domain-containing protein [Flavobacterium sp. NG2]|uniref:fibronectin type III domain-containing protein n=1 Tax=Flavobacterium sp. NG2 TaxID=3097547 RepID=UPI002A827FAF|nr:T9SS sorting signal type C domain-containing protein [Flavobacterium sp. NG2]WPR72098.1 T9SS sorting signal type C domain-containing protein [Flavobacterium sp. NG2]
MRRIFTDYSVFLFNTSFKKTFFVFLLFIIQNICYGVTKTFTSNNGNWNTATNWSPSGVPSANDDVIIPSGKTATININAVAQSINISGTLNINDGESLYVGSNPSWGNFIVNSGGKFQMPTGGSSALLVVFGNYNNNGTTDFWKSDIIITGDLLSPATSELQKQGNVIVGGNIIGDIALTGGTGEGQIYAVNPNATVSITPTSINNNVTPGDQLPSSEGATLINLVNTIIYGSTCASFTITDPSSNISTCVGGNVTVTISSSGSSPSYQWQLNSGSSGWNNISGQTTSTLSLNNVTAAMAGNKYRVKVTVSGCTKNSNYITLSIDPTTVAGTASSNQSICNGSTPSNITLSGNTGTIQWQSSTDSSSFTNISGATSSTLSSAQMGSLTATRYYRAVVTSGGCPPVNSNTVTVIVNQPSVAPTSISGTTTICNGNSTTLTLSGGTAGTNASAKWYSGVCNGTLVGTGNSITVSPTTNTTYFVRYEGICNNTSCASITVTVNSLASIPSTLSPDNVTCSSFNAKWNSATNTTKYFLDVATDNAFTNLVSGYSNLDVGNTTSRSVTGLNPSTTYYYRVRANNSNCGNSGNSGTINISTLTIAIPATGTPDNATCSSFNAKWNSATNTTKYFLDVATDNAFTNLVSGYSNLDVGNTTSHSVTGLNPSTTYYYRVRALNSSCGTSENSGTMNIATLAIAIPTTSTANNSTCSSFNAQWNSASNTTKYFLDVATDMAFTNFVSGYNNLDVGNTTSRSVTGLNPSTTYYYRVRALNSSCGTSENSGTMNISTLSIATPPTGTANNATCSSFNAQWNSASNTTKYFLDVATDMAFTNFVSGYNNLDVGNTTSRSVTGLNPSTTYYYRVRALNSSCGTSENSGTMNISTLSIATPPTGTANNATCSSFNAQWNSASNTTKYFLDVATDNAFTNFVSGYNNLDVGNTTSRSITGLNPSTTYYYRVRALNSSCGTSENSSTMSIATLSFSAPSIGTISQPTCTTTTGSFTITNYNASYSYTISPSNGVTRSGALVTAPSGTYSITTNNSTCTSLATNFTINNQPETPSIPTVGTITHPTCVISTGSVQLNGLPSTGNIVQTGDTNANYAITGGGSQTIATLAAGNYNFAISNGSCSSTTVNVVINPALTNTWDGSSWTAGTPDFTQELKFTHDYNSSADIKGCSCKITGGANVVIGSGGTMTITNEVDVLGPGTLTFQNNASLVQINDNAINSGNITYQRTTPLILNTDYVYWSSPVSGFTLGGIQTGTLYYSFNASGNSWVKESAGSTMSPSKGYIVRGSGTGLTTGSKFSQTASFNGKPNNGIIGIGVAGIGKSNLIGNPYPSAIDADAFLTANSSVLEGTLYFWTHASAIQLATGIDPNKAGSGKYAYTSDDYSTYNLTGGTGGTSGTIAAGQGFFADGNGSGGTATFNNSMRLATSGETLDNSNFFRPASGSKTAKTTTTNKIEKNRIWLNLSNSQGAYKQMLIGYITGATNDYDRGYDGISYDGNSYIDFYSINNKNLLTIQGRALPIQQTDIVPIGYRSTIAGEFTISIDKTDGLLSTMTVYLEDKLTNTTHNLKNGAYTFTTQKGTFNDRFAVSYLDKATLGTNDYTATENGIVIFQKNEQITVLSSVGLINKVQLFDISGKLILEKSKINNSEVIVDNLNSTEQVLIVKVSLENGQTYSQKIIN